MGNIRQTWDKNGNIAAAQDYYSYGEILRSYNASSGFENYKYTSKERDAESNLDYFGARYYESLTGRWMQVDPMARKYPGWSPYNYAMNNPLRNLDPDGRGLNDSNMAAQQRENKKQLEQDKKELKEAWNNGNVLGVVGNFFESIWDAVKLDAPTYLLMPEIATIDVGSSEVVGSIVKSAGDSYNSKISFGERALVKKLGHAQSQGFESAFNEIKPSTENAQSVIKNILSNPARIVKGEVTTDIYNTAGKV